MTCYRCGQEMKLLARPPYTASRTLGYWLEGKRWTMDCDRHRYFRCETCKYNAAAIETDTRAYLLEIERLPSRHPVEGDLGSVPL